MSDVISKSLPDPTLRKFRAELERIYGKRLERVVLFGSRARGDARDDSDYDIAVFLRDRFNRVTELNRLADLGTDILYEDGAVIHALAFAAATYGEATPLMHEIRKDGLPL